MLLIGPVMKTIIPVVSLSVLNFLLWASTVEPGYNKGPRDWQNMLSVKIQYRSKPQVVFMYMLHKLKQN